MRAAVYRRYGADNLRIEEVAKPVPKAGEVLLRVFAASVNSWDWDQLAGTPQGRVFNPLRPWNPILGADVSGRVEAVGAGVTRFGPGDAVFGDISTGGWGGFAEYVAAPAELLVAKPPEMSDIVAAAIPQAGLLALQGMRKRNVGPGDRVLINGAGGGVGTFAIQMARARGAEVTAVDHTDKLEFLRTVGADRVIDYTREDFARLGERYALILDVIARRSVLSYVSVLNRGGAAVIIGGRSLATMAALSLGPLLSPLTGRSVGVLAWQPSTDDLEEMKRLFADGAVRPIIDETFPLEDTGAAIAKLGEGRVKGKVVVTMQSGLETRTRSGGSGQPVFDR